MDPKELAKLFIQEEKDSVEAQQKAKAAAQAELARRQEREKIAREALQKNVIPFLDALKKETKGVFDYGMSQELGTMKPASVNFSVGSSQVSIQTSLDQVSTSIERVNGRAREFEIDDTIKSAEDLTREKIAALIYQLKTNAD